MMGSYFVYMLPVFLFLAGLAFLLISFKVIKPRNKEYDYYRLKDWYKKYKFKFMLVGLLLVVVGIGGVLLAYLFTSVVFAEF